MLQCPRFLAMLISIHILVAVLIASQKGPQMGNRQLLPKGGGYRRLKNSFAVNNQQGCEQARLDYGHLAARLSATEGAVRTMVHRLKQRYRQLLREHIAHTAATSEEVDLEMQHLREALS